MTARTCVIYAAAATASLGIGYLAGLWHQQWLVDAAALVGVAIGIGAARLDRNGDDDG